MQFATRSTRASSAFRDIHSTSRESVPNWSTKGRTGNCTCLFLIVTLTMRPAVPDLKQAQDDLDGNEHDNCPLERDALPLLV